MRTSYVQERGEVEFPEFTGERIYMREFKQAAGLPSDLARWQPTVDQMLYGIKTKYPIYLMVDQSIVEAGQSQRRPGVHIDGIWFAKEKMHGEHRTTRPGRHRDPEREPNQPELPDQPEIDPDTGDDDQIPGRKPWRQGLLLASSVFGAMAYNGDYKAMPNRDGSFNNLDMDKLIAAPMWAGTVYAGDSLKMLHESIALSRRCQRTVVRLNVVGWLPEFPKKRDFPTQENGAKQENDSSRRKTGLLRPLTAHARCGV